MLPALLADAGFAGTLSATRTLGKAGVPVTVVGSYFAPTGWSRYATRTLRSPPLARLDKFMPWLLELGRAERHVICPTSDEFLFGIALRRDEVAKYFDVYLPPLQAVLNVLDKKRLYAHAQSAGIGVPESYAPESVAELERIARGLNRPFLVKPRTQVLLNTHAKGVIVTEPSELVSRYEAFRSANTYGPEIVAACPGAGWPMLQAYHPDACHDIFVLSGFYDPERRRAIGMAARKVLQLPRRLGIGVCFEEADASRDLVDAVGRLCHASGYYGLFQLEFIREGDRLLLIDFNPRFYNFLALDVARGFELPQLVYDAARGRSADVARRMDALSGLGGRPNGGPDGKVFCNRIGLRLLTGTQRLSGAMTRADWARWRRWYRQNEARMVDAARDPDDPLPGLVNSAWQVIHHVRHPRSFVRSVVLDG
ncbi:MAG TPA: hypothetical protein VKU41_02090 [Polyangiaceae bacterium]|nr:hypothetical protein [Polyangiaceae bacterium]